MSLKKIHTIAKNGLVTFVDDAANSRDKGSTVDTTVGTKKDCLAYGYEYINSKCFAYSKQLNKDTPNRNRKAVNITKGVNNSYLGGSNVTEGSNNIVIGKNNRVLQANNNIVLGENVYADNNGGLVYGNYSVNNRATNTIYTYDGVTTDAVATELFHNGVNKFTINENYEAAYFIKASGVSLDATNNKTAQVEYWANFRFTGGTLTLTTAAPVVNSLGDYVLGFELDAVAGTPDYIRVRVTGRASETWYHNVKLDITEVRYG